MKTEALRLALEALETSMYPQQKQLQAITAIKAALKAKDEPVAWQVHPFDYGIGHQGVYARTDRPEQVEAWKRKGWNVQALYITPPQLEAKDEPYAFEASMYPRVKIDPVTGNVSIGTVTKPCGLECDCTDVCEQKTDYKALWQQMCERCDELDKKLAQRKPLTDEEIQQIFIANSVVVDNGNAYMVAGLRALNITRAIEAKLKEKNT